MEKRYVSIWFRHLNTDWFSLQKDNHQIAGSRSIPFVLRAPSHGRMIITAANLIAEKAGIYRGMVLADARAILPELEVRDHIPDLEVKLLKRIAEWCIRFTPVVGVDLPDGLMLDVTGCTHLWGGDEAYLKEVVRRLAERGYDVRAAMAGTIGVAWGVARFGKEPMVIARGLDKEALVHLPSEGLRTEAETLERLHKLGLHQVSQIVQLPRSSLRRRFGTHFIRRLDMALGQEEESVIPVEPLEPYQERLPCLDPIVTAGGIAMALQQLLERLCLHLKKDQQGLRSATFKGYRVDGKIEQVTIGTSRPSHHVSHLFKLFEHKLATIEPALGIELFILEAQKIEDHLPQQENMWEKSTGLEDLRLAELIDRLSGRAGIKIQRFVPDEHHWPERSLKRAQTINEGLIASWPSDKARPLQLLPDPERIEVTAPIPDYPPMLFRYNGILHKIINADGPERIEQEWWLQHGQHRDYYRVEDEAGNRYWLFRLGHYHDKKYQWFIHGFFS